MTLLSSRSLGACAFVVLLCGCSDNGTTTAKGADCSKYTGGVGQNGSCDALCSVSNDAMCPGNEAQVDCEKLPAKAGVDVCGVPVPEPVTGSQLLELERSSNVNEFAGSGPPALGCLQEGSFPAPPGQPQMVNMSGIAKVFKNGCQSNDLTIEVHTVKRTGGADDGTPDQLIGQAITTDADCMATGVSEDVELCPSGRWECRFTYPSVPTETELVIVTSGGQWQTIYEYNVYFSNSDVMAGAVDKDVRALKKSDYPVIAQAAMGKTVTPGNGAIGGEVHDCDNVRLINAVVAVNVSAFALTYFGDDEDDPLPIPEAEAKATGVTALYTALDIEAGPISVAAAGVQGNTLVGVGIFHARIFPDAVTTVTFRGLRPFQTPSQ